MAIKTNRLSGAISKIIGISLLGIQTLQAADITVTTVDDSTAIDGFCSLREAIDNANNDSQLHVECAAGSGTDVISFDPSLSASSIDLNSTLFITSSMEINGDMTGDNQPNITINGNDHQIFSNFSSTLGVHALNLTGGISTDGGAIRVFEGSLNMTHCLVTSNGNNNGSGGALYLRGNGTTTINNSTFVGNSAFFGGAIYIRSDHELTINNSTISGNTANVSGGGLYSSTDGNVFINNSTIENNSTLIETNSARFGGGGIYHWGIGDIRIQDSVLVGNTSETGGGVSIAQGFLVIYDSLIADNTATYGGGLAASLPSYSYIENSTFSGNTALAKENPVGGLLFTSRVTLENSTVVNNTGTGLYAEGNIVTNIKNSVFAGNETGCQLIGISGSSNNINNLDTDGSCDVEAINHITVADAMLAPLADNGGPTLTYLPLVGSPLIDAGDNNSCLKTDQRGEIRPYDGDGNGTSDCDIGAVEYNAVDDLIFKDGFD